MQFIREILHIGQTPFLRLVSLEVGIQQTFELRQHIPVHILAGNELAVVKRMQWFRRTSMLAVTMDLVCRSTPRSSSSRISVRPFRNKFLSLSDIWRTRKRHRKKGIVLHPASQGGAAEQIGMEQEGMALYPEIFPVVIIAQHLAGRYEDKSSLLVIIIMSSVPQVSAFQVFQETA